MEEKQKVELTLPNPLNIAVQVPGLPGKDGKSAYEVAVEQGFVGTVDEWLESLKGRDGANGTSEPVSMNFPTVYRMMKDRAMKVDSDSLEDLLKALLREVIPDGRYTSYLAEFKLVDGMSVAVGDTVVHVEGQPGFYVVDTNGNRQMIPDSGRLDFALSSPFDGNEKILTMEYPTGNDGTAASLTIPAVSTGGSDEELFNENGVKIYRRADGQAVIEFPVYAMFDPIYNNPNLDSLHFDSLELNELSGGGDDITITGMMLLAKLTSKAYFPRDKEMPRHVSLPSQSERLNLEFRRKREEGYADEVFSWANIDCDGSTWDNGVGVSYSKQDRL
ncbi:MAG: hypothetical protein ACFNO6_00315 [Anaeroglobus sp.]|jgi:hypothetical protein|nr:MAG TPA: hypothetical protein [Caudoviricetes sp.]